MRHGNGPAMAGNNVSDHNQLSAEDREAIRDIREQIGEILDEYAPPALTDEDKAALADAFEQLTALREAKDTTELDSLRGELRDLFHSIGRAEPTDAQADSISALKEAIATAQAPTDAEQALLDEIGAIRATYAPKELSAEDASALATLKDELAELLPANGFRLPGDPAAGGGHAGFAHGGHHGDGLLTPPPAELL